MIRISDKRLNELLNNMKGKRIVVIGDIMLDRYIWGSVSRISPEAPVPVVDIEHEQAHLGGAANVALNVKSLGGEILLLGVVGSDNSGKQVMEIVGKNNFSAEGIITDSSRPTTVKTRVIAHSQHVVRLDREQKTDIPDTIQKKLLDIVMRKIDSADAVIMEDYNKGVMVKELITELIKIANRHGKTITVDPKFNNFFQYENVSVFKPNRNEAERVMGTRLRTDEDIGKAGAMLLDKLKAKNILLTKGDKGMSLFESDGSVSHISTKALKVADVSGAGDTVISTLTLALAGGAGIREATVLANYAGGIVCGFMGIIPINPDALKKSVLQDDGNGGTGR